LNLPSRPDSDPLRPHSLPARQAQFSSRALLESFRLWTSHQQPLRFEHRFFLHCTTSRLLLFQRKPSDLTGSASLRILAATRSTAGSASSPPKSGSQAGYPGSSGFRNGAAKCRIRRRLRVRCRHVYRATWPSIQGSGIHIADVLVAMRRFRPISRCCRTWQLARLRASQNIVPVCGFLVLASAPKLMCSLGNAVVS